MLGLYIFSDLKPRGNSVLTQGPLDILQPTHFPGFRRNRRGRSQINKSQPQLAPQDSAGWKNGYYMLTLDTVPCALDPHPLPRSSGQGMAR